MRRNQTFGPDVPGKGARGRAFRSPWLEQLDPLAPLHPLRGELETDIAIVGAGIAGIATTYFCLRDTDRRVALIEQTRVGHGASGRSAGQLVTYFERPLCDMADSFGIEMAAQAQADVDAAWGLLDGMLAETGVELPIERLEGAMGMFTLNHVQVHLRRTRGFGRPLGSHSSASRFRRRRRSWRRSWMNIPISTWWCRRRGFGRRWRLITTPIPPC